MGTEEKLNSLISEFRSLKTEDERNAFDVKMKDVLAKMGSEERQAFRQAFLASAKNTISEAKQLKEEINSRLQFNGIENYLSLSRIAEEYFGKSRSWLYQRINGLIVNGKPAQFTPEERKKLADALLDISNQVKNFALSIN
ncbi:DUF5053 domain-containing protein [Parabacteroides pacaensis]|uniref:DUF5053 domain-containing protein n=1 Tax=Parabacteroides pacaensis TaxID=2086575 RepID=UPI000D10A218|nr:DUF5053 domain-containing protein [Parabacteroides pacaensis]